eukprot:CAMPEP_0119310726 /NCGR_PEP_ID=MMETSP1333-20130426/19888_1 /TAXON_ID=418940 /ORGANISM="Scyphosphaera apsteinii, Strain RCC1455" /LENGTH=454 /DNA_ID=CAMNT_0007314961 /DNA_START=94 /DNA_END=1458 /DNA_ORIENTATION=+
MGCAGSKDEQPEATPQESLVNVEKHSELSCSRRPSTMYEAKEVGSSRGSTGHSKLARRSAASEGDCIGTSTRHGVMPGPRGFVAAKINQDRGVVVWPFNGSYNEALLCVFDGHGAKGEIVAEHCVQSIPERLQRDPEKLRTQPEAVLSQVVIEIDHELLTGELGSIAQSCGTTSIIVYVKGSQLWTACSGDSRAIKGFRSGGRVAAQDLSVDCKPDSPSESERIIQCGGVVSPAHMGRPARVWADGRIGLAMSRSLGDGECKRYGVIPDPELKRFELAPAPSACADGDLFLVVASDGVWEFIPSAEAVDIVSRSSNANEASLNLVQQAAKRWRNNEGSYRDDITVVVVFLPFLQPHWDPITKDEACPAATEPDGIGLEIVEDEKRLINAGLTGLSRMTSDDLSPDPRTSQKSAGDVKGETGAAKSNEPSTFLARRLTLNSLDQAEWEALGNDET